jgi:hypothetical protein
MSWRTGVVVAVLVVLAGCSAIGVGDRTTESSVTPAPVPSVTETVQHVAVAPGLTTGGDVNATRLVAAHQEVLSRHGYAVSFVRTVENESGVTVRHRQDSGVVGSDPQTYQLSRTTIGPTGEERVERVVFDGDDIVTMVRDNGTLTRSHEEMREGAPTIDPWARAPFDPTTANRIASVLRGVAIDSVTSLDREEMPAYHVSGETLRSPNHLLVAPARSVRVTSFSATVRADGLVTDYQLQYVVLRDQKRRIVTERLQYAVWNESISASPQTGSSR